MNKLFLKILSCFIIIILIFFFNNNSKAFDTTVNFSNIDYTLSLPDWINDNNLYFWLFKSRNDTARLIISEKPIIFDISDGKIIINTLETCKIKYFTFTYYDGKVIVPPALNEYTTYEDFLEKADNYTLSTEYTSFSTSFSYSDTVFLTSSINNFDVYNIDNELILKKNYTNNIPQIGEEGNNNTTDNQNTVSDNTTTENTAALNNNEQLQQIHEDLGFICSFIIFFVLVILLRYSYKFFNMFFPI